PHLIQQQKYLKTYTEGKDQNEISFHQICHRYYYYNQRGTTYQGF
ncbi:unnamed protein product, partial [Musa acuminata subsp. burmannicoides]